MELEGRALVKSLRRIATSVSLTMEKSGLNEDLMTKKDQYAPVFHLMDVDLWEPLHVFPEKEPGSGRVHLKFEQPDH